jgi:hypothetical protein
MITNNIQFERKRRFLLVLPFLLLPLLALAFWLLHKAPNNKQVQQTAGLNTSLPGAKFDKHEKSGNKMSFYEQAKQDSDRAHSAANSTALGQFGFNKPDPNVARINDKLATINAQISQAQTTPEITPVATKPVEDKTFSEQVDKLDHLAKTINASPDSDPQMQQLSKMVEQLQAIQTPKPSLLKSPETKPDSQFKAIPATIDGNQKVLQGGIVKLKLNDSIRLKNVWLPKGQLLFGNANITNQRLLLNIKTVRIGSAIIPVDLNVYSLDGLPGINAPEAEIAGAAGNGADNALSGMEFMSMDQSLATQAAAGGIEAAKGLFSKKIRRVKVKLKGGQPLLLRLNH